jgi:hypothetical protein
MNSHADIGLFGFVSGWFDFFFLLFSDNMVATMEALFAPMIFED